MRHHAESYDDDDDDGVGVSGGGGGVGLCVVMVLVATSTTTKAQAEAPNKSIQKHVCQFMRFVSFDFQSYWIVHCCRKQYRKQEILFMNCDYQFDVVQCSDFRPTQIQRRTNHHGMGL